MKRWYVVQTHTFAEHKASLHLRRQGFDTYLPQYLRRRRHARRVEDVATPLFPRYLFVAVDVAAQRWRAIQSTVGVSHLVCHGGAPTPLPDDVVDEIRERENERGLVQIGQGSAFNKNDKVQLLNGPLADHIGLFCCMTDDHRVVILLDILGRQVRVRASLDSVAAYA